LRKRNVTCPRSLLQAAESPLLVGLISQRPFFSH
jgi:hypothetical protein